MFFLNLSRIAILLAVIAISSAIIAGFFGRVHPALDSFSHFRAHLGVALVLCALLLLALKFRWNAAAALLLGAAAIASTTSGTLFKLGSAQAALAGHDGSTTYTLLQINLRKDHPDPVRVLAFIKREEPDFVTLDEVSTMWAEQLATLSDEYPYRAICNPRLLGSAIFSKRPFIEDLKCEARGALAITAVDLDGQRLALAAVHLRWPWPFRQHQQINSLAPTLRDMGETGILAGDLNASPWSHATRKMAAAGGFTIVEGIGATWLDYMFPRSMRWIGLPIDHVMVKGAVRVRKASVLEDVGSDHWPVMLEFTLGDGAHQNVSTLD